VNASAAPSGEAMAPLEELVRRAQDAARFQCAWISLLEDGCERIVAARGFAPRDLAAGESLALAVADLREALFVEDALRSAWREHPLVVSAPRVRALAIVPLAGADGLAVGTLTVADPKPRALAPAQR